MKLNKLAKEAHENSKLKGFYDNPNENVAEKLMLIVSEVSEALKAHRKNKYTDITQYEKIKSWDIECAFNEWIKDTFEDEIADVFICLFDLCGWLDIDIEKHIQLKMAYNKTRPYKHGKEY